MEPLRTITADEVETFWRVGVVCLRGVLAPSLLSSMEGPVGRLIELPEMANLSAMGDALSEGGQVVLRDDGQAGRQRGRFVSGVDHWRHHPEFREFACSSPLPAIAAAVLRSAQINLWEDSLLVKEPGTRERTAWHQDLAYFHVAGEQVCTVWCPLDEVTAATGAVKFAVGSHRWSEVFRPNLFVSTMTIPGATGPVVPDIDALAERGEVEIVSFDTEPGDITIHHARTLHGAGPNTSSAVWRRAISVRYCGDDVRYYLRDGAPKKPHHEHVADGDPLVGPECPVVLGGRSAQGGS
jgi:ectoine hydroxylase-related dioxygenase (phytanoyl-CoA dioxygenase family)